MLIEIQIKILRTPLATSICLSLLTLLKNAEQIKRPSVRQAILDGVDRLEKNRRLIILKGDATLPYSLEALTYHSVNKTTGQVLTAIGVK